MDTIDIFTLFTFGWFSEQPIADPQLALFTDGWFGSEISGGNAVLFGINF